MAQTKLEADNKVSKADQKVSQFDWFGVYKTENQQNAAKLYVEAATQYKTLNKYDKAGICYTKAAQCHMEIQNNMKAKRLWTESAKCFSNTDYKMAVDMYNKVISLELEAYRFDSAANLHGEIGDMLDELGFSQNAIDHYQVSAELYERENDTINKHQMLVKSARICDRISEWEKSIKIFENVCNECNCLLQNLQRKIKEYLFSAMLSQICLYINDNAIFYQHKIYIGSTECDVLKRKLICGYCLSTKMDIPFEMVKIILGYYVLEFRNALFVINAGYCNISTIYAVSQECKLITCIVECLPRNIIKFKDAIRSYDVIAKMSPTLTLIYDIGKYMEEYSRYGCGLGWPSDLEDEQTNDYYHSNPFDVTDTTGAPDLDLL